MNKVFQSKVWVQSLRAYIVFTIMLGLIYPLTITVISQMLMPYKANGSLLQKNNIIIGSRLVGQSFTDIKYFQSRLSANNYDGVSSGGANLGPSSKKLIDNTADKILKVRRENGISPDIKIPADMVLTSASGLDPHISPENALLQAERISKIRGISVAALKKMIQKNTDSDFIGIWGQPGVNVLALNIELDAADRHK